MRDILKHMQKEVTEEKLLSSYPVNEGYATHEISKEEFVRQLQHAGNWEIVSASHRDYFDLNNNNTPSHKFSPANSIKSIEQIADRFDTFEMSDEVPPRLIAKNPDSFVHIEINNLQNELEKQGGTYTREAVNEIAPMPAKEKYVKVYFRIEAGYKWGAGMEKEKTDAFFKEVTGIFTKAGWKPKKCEIGAGCPEFMRGQESLYCHPMDISGWVKESSVQGIESLLQNGKTFKFRNTDIVSEGYEYTPEEFKQALEAIRPEVEAELLTRFKTPRRNLVKRLDGMFTMDYGRKLVRQVKAMHDSGISSVGASHDTTAQKFIMDVINGLVAQGKMIKHGENMYRTAGPKDVAKKPTPMESVEVIGELKEGVYQELKDAGVPLDNHASDLYAKVTPESEAIVKKYEAEGYISPSRFTNNIDKTQWFDIPFMYDPWWDKRTGNAMKSESKVNEADGSELYNLVHVYVPDWKNTLNVSSGDPKAGGEEVHRIMTEVLPQGWNISVQESQDQSMYESKVKENHYSARFTGRKVGAIGIIHYIVDQVEGANEEEARKNLYNKYEHISNLVLKDSSRDDVDESKVIEALDIKVSGAFHKVLDAVKQLVKSEDFDPSTAHKTITKQFGGETGDTGGNFIITYIPASKEYYIGVSFVNPISVVLYRKGRDMEAITSGDDCFEDDGRTRLRRVEVKESKVNEVHMNDEDYTGKLGQLDSGSAWEMYSFDRAAYAFWNGFANGLKKSGYSDQQIKIVLQSKMTRWLLDQNEDQLEDLGRAMGTKMGADKKGLQSLFAEAKKYGNESVNEDESALKVLTKDHIYDAMDAALNDVFGSLLAKEGITTGDISPEESLRYDDAVQTITDVFIGMVSGNRVAMERIMKLSEKYRLVEHKTIPLAKVLEMAGVLDQDTKNKFIDLAGALSPENLSCDGELSQVQCRAKYKSLMSEWKALEQKIGRKVSEEEVWKWDVREGKVKEGLTNYSYATILGLIAQRTPEQIKDYISMGVELGQLSQQEADALVAKLK